MEYPIPYAKYQENLRKGEFIGLRCLKCNSVSFPPRAICQECGITDFSEVRLTGQGTIKTFTVIRVPPEGRKPPYVIVMVELKEGPCVMGNLSGIEPERADMGLIGKRVVMKPVPVKGDLLLRGEFMAPCFLIEE